MIKGPVKRFYCDKAIITIVDIFRITCRKEVMKKEDNCFFKKTGVLNFNLTIKKISDLHYDCLFYQRKPNQKICGKK